MADIGSAERAKVFISYSRRDSSDFAEELVAGLELAGFAPLLDHHDIAAGEDWEVRLGGLIRQADTVVFVVSPEAVKSQRCAWEVDHALTDAKRVLPVIFKTVPDADIPPKLQRRQFVRFDTGQGINRPLALLVDALRQDLDWLREHTRLSESAVRWRARGAPESMLLRGDDLAAAKSWLDARKASAPPITDELRDFVIASGQAETARLAGARVARRRLHQAQVFAAFCALVFLAAVIAWWNQAWLRERVYAAGNVHALAAAQEQTLAAKQSFKECTDCPEMVVVPAGSFVMGSPGNEPGHKPSEAPQHKVTIANAFAVSKFELTFAGWDACAAHGDCDPRISDGGFGRNAQPVINVTWNDARQYAAWLSDITGKPYRLLSEAEYEYAARAGSQTAYPWGEDIGTGNANCIDCGGQWNGKQPAPVGSFAANAFGLYDMIGNVWEWVEDCGHEDYNGAPKDGAAWIAEKNCDSRVARGGTFNVLPAAVRSGSRLLLTSSSVYFNLGFRVARSLTPNQ
jgi:formylglycine-generating enzyme required for sulfatase activity